MKRRIAGLHQHTAISSVRLTDRWEPREEGLDAIETTRHVSVIAITLSKASAWQGRRLPGWWAARLVGPLGLAARPLGLAGTGRLVCDAASSVARARQPAGRPLRPAAVLALQLLCTTAFSQRRSRWTRRRRATSRRCRRAR